jgi:cytochrome b561
MLKNTSENYGSLAKWLHWIAGLFILAMLIMGYLTTVLDHPGSLYFYHKSLGATLLIVMVVRLIWRWCNPQPKHPQIPRPQQAVAKLVHYLLYLATFVMIFAGWGMSSYSGHGVPFWGLANVGLPVALNKPLANWFEAVHHWAAWSLFVLIIIHILAALYHQLIVRDNLIGSILPQKKRNLFK